MAGPWEKYAQPAPQSGPWTKFAVGQSPAPETSAAGDVGQGVLTGLARGVAGVAGLPGDIQGLIGKGIGIARDALIGDVTPERRAEINAAKEGVNFLTSDNIKSAASSATGVDLPEPKTTAGKYAETAAEFVPGSILGPGRLIPKVLGLGVAPGLASEAGGQMLEGTPAEPYARVAGAFLGMGAGPAARRMVTPLPTSPERIALADTLAREGVDVTAGQRTGSNKLRYTESEIGGDRAGNVMERQGEQFTAAALRRIGETAERATPEVLNRAYQRIGHEFDALANRNNVIPDQQFATDLGDTLNWYAGRVSAPNRAPIIRNYATEIGNAVRSGAIDGPTYQSLRSRISADARGAGDQYIQHTLNDLVGTLDDAMERSIAARNPNDLGAWQEARRQYRDYLVVEKAATGAGENAAAGIISPSSLRNATVRQGRRAYARGQGDFAELARAGEGIMKPLPNSGTAGRTAARNVLSAVPTFVGGAAGATHGMDAAIMGALAGALAPSAAGRVVMSRPMQAWLGNQRIPAARNAANRELVRAIDLFLASQHERPAIAGP